MKLDKKSIKEGDEVWVASAGCHGGEPYAHVYGGVVVAAGGDGSFCYRTADGRVDTCHRWMWSPASSTEAESWLAAAEQLDKIAAGLTAKANECRAKAGAEVVTT